MKEKTLIKSIVLLSIFILLFGFKSYSQCNISSSACPIQICAGDPVILSSSGACGYLLNNNYNNGTVGVGWSSNASPMFNNPCGPGIDATIHLWIGSATNFPRQLTTDTFDVSLGGCKVQWEMRYAMDENTIDCEDPDLPGEGVHLQYSLNYGLSWTDINYWTPTTNKTGPLYSWGFFMEYVPAIAATNHTMFRYYQNVTSGNNWDHWGLDNCEIFCPATQNVLWSHGPTVFNPPPVYPTHDTMFIVTITDTINNTFATDSIWITVNPIPTATFSLSSTSICDYDSVVVTYTGTAGSTANYSWDFDGGDTISGSGQGPFVIKWQTNGLHQVSLSVSEKNCTSPTESKTLTVSESPLISFIPSAIDGCEPLEITFTDNTTPVPSSWLWEFGDGNTSNLQNPVHTYQNAGTYDLKLTTHTSDGCFDSYESIGLIHVYPQPIAGFTIPNEIITIQEPIVHCTDISQNGTNWSWTFGDGIGTSTLRNPSYTYNELGLFGIWQIVYTEYGCIDSTYLEVMVIDDVLTFPNVITPNGDGFNDKFEITNIENYISSKLIIFNRWGNKVYEVDNYKNDWAGEGLPDGVYYFILTFHGYLKDGSEKGSLTIMR